MTRIHRGLTHAEVITVLTPDQIADDLTGHVFLAKIRNSDRDLVADISSAFTLRNGTTNVIDFNLEPNASWNLPAGGFWWDLVSEKAGAKFFIIPTERITIETPSTTNE